MWLQVNITGETVTFFVSQLDMLGHDMKWASFHVVEVMSSSKFHIKSVGYLAAVQSFSSDTDVLMLTTNLLKKVRLAAFFEHLFASNTIGLTSSCAGSEL